MPALRATVVELGPGDLIVLASDGINLALDRPAPLRERTQTIADHILAERAVADDDALVVVARFGAKAP
jgi:hypothetical protein